MKSGCGITRRLVSDERGQDVVEYALLTALGGLTALAVWQVIAAACATAYTTADANVQAIAEPPNPQ